MARTKGCRTLTNEERNKIAKDLKQGKTYKELMSKYGLRSDSSLRNICKEFNITYIPANKRNNQTCLFNDEPSKDYRVSIRLDENNILIINQGINEIYLIGDDVKRIINLYIGDR